MGAIAACWHPSHAGFVARQSGLLGPVPYWLCDTCEGDAGAASDCSQPLSEPEEIVMTCVLIPVEGSDNSTRAVDAACRQLAYGQPATVHLLNVQPPINSGSVKNHLSQDLIDKFSQELGKTALEPARARLRDAGIAFTSHVEVGDVAQTIARYVRDLYCDQVIMGTRGLGSGAIGAISGLLMGSIATKVLHLVAVPVTFVK
jgi:nucleotide-binding universal stress UspA family protein